MTPPPSTRMITHHPQGLAHLCNRSPTFIRQPPGSTPSVIRQPPSSTPPAICKPYVLNAPLTSPPSPFSSQRTPSLQTPSCPRSAPSLCIPQAGQPPSIAPCQLLTAAHALHPLPNSSS